MRSRASDCAWMRLRRIRRSAGEARSSTVPRSSIASVSECCSSRSGVYGATTAARSGCSRTALYAAAAAANVSPTARKSTGPSVCPTAAASVSVTVSTAGMIETSALAASERIASVRSCSRRTSSKSECGSRSLAKARPRWVRVALTTRSRTPAKSSASSVRESAIVPKMRASSSPARWPARDRPFPATPSSLGPRENRAR